MSFDNNGASAETTAATHDNSFFSILKEAVWGSSRDFTTGSLKVGIFVLAVPMIIEMFAESLFAIVDIFFVARLGASAIAVVGITESMMYLVYSVAIGISVGATATVSRRIGEKDPDGASRAAAHSIYLGLAASFVIGVIGIVFARNLLRLMGADESVIAEGATFTRVMLGGNVVVMMLFLLNAIFRGAGDATIAMRVLWMANVLNIILGPCFIFGLWIFPELGVTGAAVATTIGRGIGASIAACTLLFGERRISIDSKHWAFNPQLIVRLVKVSAPAVLQFFIQTASFIGLVRVVTGFGTVAVAGYQIGMRVVIFALLPSLGLANAAATLVGQNLGAGKPERAERAVWTACLYNGIVQTTIGFLFVIFAGNIAGFFTTDIEVAAYATDALRIIAYGFLFYSVGMVLETAFNGAGDTWTPTYLALGVFWMFEIPLAFILAYGFSWVGMLNDYLPFEISFLNEIAKIKFKLGAHGVFWAIAIAFSVLAVAAAILFRRGKWKLKVV